MMITGATEKTAICHRYRFKIQIGITWWYFFNDLRYSVSTASGLGLIITQLLCYKSSNSTQWNSISNMTFSKSLSVDAPCSILLYSRYQDNQVLWRKKEWIVCNEAFCSQWLVV